MLFLNIFRRSESENEVHWSVCCFKKPQRHPEQQHQQYTHSLIFVIQIKGSFALEPSVRPHRLYSLKRVFSTWQHTLHNLHVSTKMLNEEADETHWFISNWCTVFSAQCTPHSTYIHCMVKRYSKRISLFNSTNQSPK